MTAVEHGRAAAANFDAPLGDAAAAPGECKCNILLVDDRVENLVALESVLSDLGQNLVRANSGRDALKRLLDEDFAVILLDVQMPDMDGFETAALIRARERSQHTPIVFLTAINKTDRHVSRGYSVGAVDYVFKPFDPEVLRAKVAAFVELSRKTQQLQLEVAQRKQAEAALDGSHALLQAISRGLVRFVSDPAPGPTLEQMLHDVADLTGSEYGFVAEVARAGGGRRELRTLAVAECASSRMPREFYCGDGNAVAQAFGLKSLLADRPGGRRPYVIDGPALAMKGLPAGHPSVTSFVGLPFYQGGELVGVVALANREDGYGEETVSYLEPFLSTCASIVIAHRNELRRQRAEAEVKKLNEDLERRVVERTAELEAANRELGNEVAERKRAQEDLGSKQEQIQALNERLQRAMTETHHRVKNNLQIIAAMVDMRLLEGTPTISSAEIKRLGSYVRTLAAVHEILTQQAKEDGQAHDISAKEILDRLLPMLQEATGGRTIRAVIADASLTARQGTSLALVTNELISNGLKHGHGDVEVALRVDGAWAELSVCDDGPGFPAGFEPAKAANTGLELVDNLSRWDLGGEVRFGNREQGGAIVTIRIPLETT